MWCRRTADAALQDLDIIHSRYPGRMLILVAGHHYKMDYDVMIETNLSNQARFTVGCAEVPARDAALPSSPTDSHDH